jgi:hypothetical protein
MQPITLSTSTSFYVRERNKALLLAASRYADALVIAGARGPDTFRRSPDAVRIKPVLFDGEGYRGNELHPEIWANDQRAVGADRVLLPGVAIQWDKSDTTFATRLLQEQSRLGHDLDATVLVAIDSRWIAKRTLELLHLLLATERPVAIVPMHRDDPFGSNAAVDGLRTLCRRLPSISLLRTDHAAIGALASGAVHGSIGLTTSTRHFAPPSFHPSTFGDRSPRLFLRELVNWYRASEVAGWLAAGIPVTCLLGCCGGQRLERYLDPSNNAVEHNLCSLDTLAEYVLGTDPHDRESLWLEVCRKAVALYGDGWFRGPTNPKPQLLSWAFV